MDCIGEVGHNGIGDRFVNTIGAPNSDCMLAGFMGLQRAEDIPIKI